MRLKADTLISQVTCIELLMLYSNTQQDSVLQLAVMRHGFVECQRNSNGSISFPIRRVSITAPL